MRVNIFGGSKMFGFKPIWSQTFDGQLLILIFLGGGDWKTFLGQILLGCWNGMECVHYAWHMWCFLTKLSNKVCFVKFQPSRLFSCYNYPMKLCQPLIMCMVKYILNLQKKLYYDKLDTLNLILIGSVSVFDKQSLMF